TVTTRIATGTGIDAAATVWGGVAAPASPKNFDVEELEAGKLKFTWDPVTTNVYGHEIAPSQVKYTITIGGSSRVLAKDLEGSEALIDYPTAGDPQDITYFTLKASTAAGAAAQTAVTPTVAVGDPYVMPFAEGFPGGLLTSGHVAEVIPDEKNAPAYWGYFAQLTNDGIQPVTADGGLMAFFPYENGDVSTFRTGKISVDADSTNPYFTFYYFNIPGAKDYFKVAVDADTVKTICVGGDVRGWEEVLIPLTEYKGKVIRISFTGYCVDSNVKIAVDDLSVVDLSLEDLELTRVRIPYEHKPGVDHLCVIRVSNLGVNTSGEYTLTVTGADREFASFKGTALKRGETAEHEFVLNHGFDMSGEMIYAVELEYAADENQDNNTAEVKSQIQPVTLPSVAEVAVQQGSDGYDLSW
ncbi:MAG: hypothetical protein K2J07_01365, partial [Muribaculaceae bacterium]|nr:hypothetical protein [Muribaculaceae bacterium]